MRNMMMALGAVLALAASPALAGDQDFTLHNSTGYTIEKVYVSAAKTDDWEEDVLGRDTLSDEESVNISFEKGTRGCKYDLKVVYDDGDEAEWGGLNLCEVSEVEIKYNRKTGETSAYTK